ncbi:hypothetical protein QNE86_001090 [Vibrio vulnificus]|nr:hypothetical protein [Vibrio vulnificus]
MAKFLTALTFVRHPRECGDPFKARGCFEWIKPTKSVRSALAEEWIPVCARMTDIESGEISYRPWLLLVILANAVTDLKREDICESIKPTKSVRSAFSEEWIPACAGVTDIESSEISYHPRFAHHPRERGDPFDSEWRRWRVPT